MNEQQYTKVWGAVMLAHAMGAVLVQMHWGVEGRTRIIPNDESQLIGSPLGETVPFDYREEHEWTAKYTDVNQRNACLCPMAAVILCDQPPKDFHPIDAAAQCLGVRPTLVDAFTHGWDGTKGWKGDATAQECVPEMAAWYQAGVRMRQEYTRFLSLQGRFASLVAASEDA